MEAINDTNKFKKYIAGIDPISTFGKIMVFGTSENNAKHFEQQWLASFDDRGVGFFNSTKRDDLLEINFNLVAEIIEVEELKK